MKYVLAVILGIYSSLLCAEQINDPKTVKRIFSETPTVAGFMSVEGFPQCLFGIMYIDLSKESGKAQFSMLLSAKATNQKIVRLDYTLGAQGTCTVVGLHIE